ncbi:RING/U-box superfamily protein [Euphorbia peplus]|nr:RING/U-box superfamily protein [Euphorbia peplus]
MAEIVTLDDDDDDEPFLCTSLSSNGNTKRTPISVEHYSAQRDLNLAIMSSFCSTKHPNNFIDLSQENQTISHNVDDYDDTIDFDVRVLNFKPRSSSKKRAREKGQSSKSNTNPEFLCEICFDPKHKDESFSINGCSHCYCKDCMANYVRSKLHDNVSQISCPVPECKGFLEPHDCRSILPPEVFDRWGNALCEALILGSQKFYCPYKDCSVMLIDDGGVVVRESECPNCRRLFCAQCKVPWHGGIECVEFQKLHKDEREREDIMLMKLAKNKHWRRCPKCRVFVERTEGCRFMKCRCGASFCYGCGTQKISTATHYCDFCKG